MEEPEWGEVVSAPALPATGAVDWVGDILLGDFARGPIEKHGWDWPLARVKPMFRSAVVVGNAEGPITARTEKHFPQQVWSYNAEPPAARAMAQAGLGVLSLANNHMLDRGPAGLADSIRNLRSVGVQTLGAGRDLAEASAPVWVESPAGRIAVLGMSERWSAEYEATAERPGALTLSKAAVRRAVRAARQQGARLVVAFVHWGDNYASVNEPQRRFADVLEGAGVDLVVGHHPHVVQPVEQVGRMPVLWSLGNFVFGTPGRWTKEQPGVGLVATTRFDEGGLRSVEFQCVDVDNRRVKYQPRPCAARERETAWKRLGPKVVVEGELARWNLP